MLIVVLVVTVLFVLFLRTNPTGREFFDRARTLIAVNLLRRLLRSTARSVLVTILAAILTANRKLSVVTRDYV